MFIKSSNGHNHVTEMHSLQYFVPRCSLTVHLNFLTYWGVEYWNVLSNEIVNKFSLAKFKYNVKSYDL